MATPSASDITRLLGEWSDGDESALDELMPLVYQELRRIAGRYMRHESPGHTLQTSALINEAYLRLVDQRGVRWQNRAHFYGVAARLMRRILVDHARTRTRVKRGGGARQVDLGDVALVCEQASQVVALDDALRSLAEMDPRKSQIVEIRFFGGLTHEEIAEVLGVTVRTVERDWAKARVLLRDALAA